MPYAIRKVRNKNCYSVTNKETGQVKARCSSLKNAKAQVRLLYGIDSGSLVPIKSPRSSRKYRSVRSTRKRSPRSSRSTRRNRSPKTKRSSRSKRY